MGLDIHGINFLYYASKKNKLRKTVTLGRQGIHVSSEEIMNILKLDRIIKYGEYCEELLKDQFGASLVDSYDNSDYENATHIQDFNKLFDLHEEYDTVIDLGVLEHLFNVPNALLNISKLCIIGGKIIHILPANNFCGHGFWQFSPELFLSLYSKKNGYDNTEIFLADLKDNLHWYKVKTLPAGERLTFASCSQVYVLVITTKISSVFYDNVQQSDYLYLWNNSNKDVLPAENKEQNAVTLALKSILKAFNLFNFILELKNRFNKNHVELFKLSNHPQLIKCKISMLIE
jgi:hypothetical protein